MMYAGSKRRIASKLLPHILVGRKKDQYYIEPFAGGCNSLCLVGGNRIGNDIDGYLISMWKALQNGWLPPSNVSEEQYHSIRLSPENYPPELVSFVGYLCSYRGKWMAGYAYSQDGINYSRVGRDSLLQQVPGIKRVYFTSVDYRRMILPPRSIIYCDPPYEGVLGYDTNFHHKLFWKWARERGQEGHRVFVSEYNAPSDFKCIRTIPCRVTMDHATEKIAYEKLFRYDPAAKFP